MNEQGLITWKDDDGNSKALAFNQLYAALQNYTPPHKSFSSDIYRDYYATDISIRDEYSRGDYDNFRPGEVKPTSPRGIMIACSNEYENNGIIHNIVDLMGDFAAQGIEINHPKKRIQNLCREWFKKVEGYRVSERIANYAVRLANVIVRRETAPVPLKEVNKMYQNTANNQPPELKKREIPWSYTFLNPITLEIIGEELMPLTTLKNPLLAISIPRHIANSMLTPDDLTKQILQFIPADIIKSVKTGGNKIPLKPDKIRSIYYKKDDWKMWATSLIYPILDDLHILRKMKQADLAALDGAISQIRIWKLGSIEHKIIPSDAAINKLAEILMQNMGGGVLDLIWGPDLEYQDTSSTLHQFLGETKYVPTLNRIFAGLGIPPLFTGSSSSGGFSNNFIAIKTLIERLNYIRKLIVEFWDFELKLLQKALGFSQPATVSFDKMSLNDESSVLTLMRDLVDRNYLSLESLHEMISVNPEIENVRIKREAKARKNKKMPEKLGPFVSTEETIKRAMAQSGAYTPSEFGVELEERKPGEKSLKDIEAKMNKDAKKESMKGSPGQGRPKAKKDTVKRKQKQVKPRRSETRSGFIQAFAWAEDAQNKISEVITPIYLEQKGKKNLRQLTSKEFDELENKKFAVLSSIPLNSPYTEEQIKLSLSAEIPVINKKLLDKSLAQYLEKSGNDITIERRRTIQSGVYALMNSEGAKYETNNINNDLPTLS
jgi:hypothetical protein